MGVILVMIGSLMIFWGIFGAAYFGGEGEVLGVFVCVVMAGLGPWVQLAGFQSMTN